MQIGDILSTVDPKKAEDYAKSVCLHAKGTVRLGAWIKLPLFGMMVPLAALVLRYMNRLTGLFGMLLIIVILLTTALGLLAVLSWKLTFDGETGWICIQSFFKGTTRFHVSEITEIRTDTSHSYRGLIHTYDRLYFTAAGVQHSVMLRAFMMFDDARDQGYSFGDSGVESFHRYLDMYARFLSDPAQGLRPPDTGQTQMPLDAAKLAESLLADAPRLPKYKPRMRGMGEIINMPNPRTAGSGGTGASFLAEMMQQYNVSESSVANFTAGVGGGHPSSPKKAVVTAASVPALKEITDMTDIPELPAEEIPDVSDGKAIKEKPITEALPPEPEELAQPVQAPKPAPAVNVTPESMAKMRLPQDFAEQPKPKPAVTVTPESMAKMRLPQSFGEQPSAFPDPTAQGFPDPTWRPDPAAPVQAPEPAAEQPEPVPELSEPAPAPVPTPVTEKPPVDVDALFNQVLAEHGKPRHPEKPRRRGLFGR
ncbi:MAG: hypothetical protein K5695_10200 [Oscillospiraceae bacterium]|nr:hypothetical protein [Oscillospiraceae bacterium]